VIGAEWVLNLIPVPLADKGIGHRSFLYQVFCARGNIHSGTVRFTESALAS